MIWELCTAQMLYRDWDSRLNILDRACSEFPHCTGSAVPGCWSARMQFILSWLVNCTIVMLISFLCLGAWILTAKNTCLVSSIEITYIYLVNHLIEIKNWHSYKKTASFYKFQDSNKFRTSSYKQGNWILSVLWYAPCMDHHSSIFS